MKSGPRHDLRVIAWEVTRRCEFTCRHCRGSAENRSYENELSGSECRRVLEGIAAAGRPIVILTGGEPMMREDIYDIARYGSDLGLRMVLAPCGPLVTDESVRRMKDADIRRISLSIDGADAVTHDRFRGMEGGFDGVIRAAGIVRRGGLDFQVNTTVSKHNVHQLPEILNLAVRIGASSFHPFLLVPTGRGRDLLEDEISPREYEEILTWFYERSKDSPLTVKPTCAPHYYRIVRQRGADSSPRAGVRGFDAHTKGCLGGQGFAFISHTGRVQICGFLDAEAGDIRKSGYDFAGIWDTSPLFLRMRNRSEYGGKCGICEYWTVCGGCRARAFALTGDYMAEEPFCLYDPSVLRRS
jgi:heme b synthase